MSRVENGLSIALPVFNGQEKLEPLHRFSPYDFDGQLRP